MNKEGLERVANWLRQDVIMMLTAAGSGHAGGALGMADLLAALYFDFLKINPKDPHNSGRDILALSAGHIGPVQYAALAERGYFPRQELLRLRKFGSILQGHPHSRETAGVELSSGSLGQGLSQAVGFALAARLDHRPNRVVAILSDGEHDEGQTWEAIMLAAKERLANLLVIVDRNGIQLEGPTETIMPLTDLGAKYSQFSWEVEEIDGNNMDSILKALHMGSGPRCIIAHTVLGKGVDFMENNHLWHGKTPNQEEAESALRQLNHV